MTFAFPEALVDGYQELVPTLTNDPKDRHVLAAAVASHSQVIVTSNLRHFPSGALAPFGVAAQSPDAFLSRLTERSPQVMVRLVRQQARDMGRPPVTVHELLDRLEKSVPGFARQIRTLLEPSS